MKEKFDKTIRTINRITVHSGTFHSDDVFCVAVSKILNVNVEIERINNADYRITDISKGHIVADIGMGPFDHHQKDCPYREDGIKHCGASRVWLVYGVSVINQIYPELSPESCEKVSDKIYNHLLRTISALDNGDTSFPQNVFSIATIVEGFRPSWDSELTDDEAFLNAVDCVQKILINEIIRYAAEERAKPYVKACIQKMQDGVVVLDKLYDWKVTLIEEINAKVVVYPSKRGGYNVEPIPNEIEEITYRVNVPDEWRGRKGDDADKVQKGMTFCHMKGFVIAFDTLENAVAAAKKLSEQI